MAEQEQDFTTFIEDDVSDYFSVAPKKITATDIPRDTFALIYKSFGAGHFGNLPKGHQFDGIVSSTAFSFTGLVVWALSNNIGNLFDHLLNNWQSYFLYTGKSSGGLPYWILVEYPSSNNDFDVNMVVGTRYYYWPTRSGSTVQIDIYDDIARTSPVAVLVVTGNTQGFEFLYPAASIGDAQPIRLMSGDVSNYVLLDETEAIIPIHAFKRGRR